MTIKLNRNKIKYVLQTKDESKTGILFSSVSFLSYSYESRTLINIF